MSDVLSSNGRRNFILRTQSFYLPFWTVAWVLRVADVSAIVLAGVFGAVCFQLVVYDRYVGMSQGAEIGVLGGLAFIFLNELLRVYRFEVAINPGREIQRILTVWGAVTLLLALMAFLLKVGESYSRGNLICFAIFAPVFLLICRRLIGRSFSEAISHGRIQGKRLVLIGQADQLGSLEAQQLLSEFGFTEVDRIVLPDVGVDGSDATLQSVDEAIRVSGVMKADAIGLALPWASQDLIRLVCQRLHRSPLPIRLLPDLGVRALARNSDFELKPPLCIDVQRAPLSGREQFVKRVFDCVISLLAITLLSPLILLAAIAIKIESKGPILFRQRRGGFNHVPFVILKFRTMTEWSDDGGNVQHAKRNDCRTTRVGRFLRETSIDELPQLINVLRGEMSLIGPRPHALSHDSDYGRELADYAFRYHVKPGITGWAQANGLRGGTSDLEDIRQRVKLDLWYIKNWSFFLDMKIIVLTWFQVIHRTNAY
jgi:undecaprenyl-phosphate galactose phosphotransferase/putative colanic acid biosynthesis UDP-glucose lipid carrier transferase